MVGCSGLNIYDTLQIWAFKDQMPPRLSVITTSWYPENPDTSFTITIIYLPFGVKHHTFHTSYTVRPYAKLSPLSQKSVLQKLNLLGSRPGCASSQCRM